MLGENTGKDRLETYEMRRMAARNLYDTKEYFRVRSDYYDAYKANKIDEKMILYEAFSGRGITCNPGALFRHLLDDPRFLDYKHVWSLEESVLRESVIDEFRGRENVIFVCPQTKSYYKYLSTAKYLVNNSTWPNYFTKKPGQVVINTWHGIPMKSLGYDEPKGKIGTGNTIRNFLSTDYIVSPVEYTTNMFKNAYNLEGIYEGKFLEAGHPRVDRTLKADKHAVCDELRRYGVRCDAGKKWILYAPTWRGEKFRAESIQLEVVEDYDRLAAAIESHIDRTEYQIFVKPHQIVYEALQKRGRMPGNYYCIF